MRVGQEVVRAPETIVDGIRHQSKSGQQAMRGRVVFVHPKGRFHTVEFTVGGVTVRESFAGVEDWVYG